MVELTSKKIGPSELKYRGERNYVHGTSVYKWVTNYLSSAFDTDDMTFKMVIHGFSNKQFYFVFTTENEGLDKPQGGQIEISTSFGLHGWLVESDKEVVKREPYLEQEIIKQSHIRGDRSINMEGEVAFHPIEVLVALTKELHTREFSEQEGKWVFTRLELDRLLEFSDSQKLTVQIQRSIGTRLTSSSIYSGPDQIGKIYFSMVKQWPK